MNKTFAIALAVLGILIMFLTGCGLERNIIYRLPSMAEEIRYLDNGWLYFNLEGHKYLFMWDKVSGGIGLTEVHE